MRSPVRIWLSAPEKRLPHRGGRFFASVGIRTGDLHLSEHQRADIGIAALARQRYASSNLAISSKEAVAPFGAAASFVSVRFRTGDLHLSERQRADIGITALARQRYALCQFESGYQLQRSSCPFGAAASFVSVGIRTGDLHLSERQRADIGITALARQHYALCQFATAHKRAQPFLDCA